MKTTIKTLAAAIICLAISTSTLIGKNKQTSTTDFVVNGLIIKTEKKLDSKCKLELFCENNLIESSLTNLNKPFEYKLQKNHWYTIRVTKEGFLPLLISFNTEVENGEVITEGFFQFETELISLEQAKYMDKDLIDFPVGLVAYNKETKAFEARDQYTTNYLAGLFYPTIKDPNIVKEYVTKGNLHNNMC